MRRIGSGLHQFWEKAYTDNLTGLAAMVAYNLLLSVFPVALIALFVAGQVLQPGARALRPRGPAAALPDRRRRRRCATRCARSASPPRPAGIIALVASLWVGASFWGALDTAFCRIYHSPCRSWVRQKLFGLGMLGLVLLFFAATVRCRPPSRCCLAATPTCRSASRTAALSTRSRSRVGFVDHVRRAATIYRTVPNAAGAVVRRLARRARRDGRDRHRRLRLPVLPEQRRALAASARRSSSS